MRRTHKPWLVLARGSLEASSRDTCVSPIYHERVFKSSNSKNIMVAAAGCRIVKVNASGLRPLAVVLRFSHHYVTSDPVKG